MDTLVITEAFIKPFKFWYNGQTTTGMRFRNELFGEVLIAPVDDRDRFFQQLDRLTLNDAGIVVTASKYRYIAWVNLTAPKAPYLMGQSALPDEPMLQAA